MSVVLHVIKTCGVSCLTQISQRFFFSPYIMLVGMSKGFSINIERGLPYTKGLHSSVKMTIGKYPLLVSGAFR